MFFKTLSRVPWALRVLGVAALLLSYAAQTSIPARADGDDALKNKIFIQQVTDPTFKQLLDEKAFPIGEDSDKGVKGSTIRVNTKALMRAANSEAPIPQAIKLHTICNSHITRKDFNNWTRWYQEDGNTQVFRMFKGEHNVRNKRPDAGRIEAFTNLSWKRSDEAWHYWIGTYTIVKPHGAMIFQVKNDKNDWAVSIGMNDEGDIKLNHRRGQEDVVIAKRMVAKPFQIGIRDNGHNYEVYYNGEKVGEGEYDRPSGETVFRWGMYDGTFRHDAMLLVTGVRLE